VSKWSDAACDRLLADVLTSPAPLQLGETVTIERGHEEFTVVGFELDGECVKLDDGKTVFTVYAWRVTRKAGA
jgi:hypothetical protein